MAKLDGCILGQNKALRDGGSTFVDVSCKNFNNAKMI